MRFFRITSVLFLFLSLVFCSCTKPHEATAETSNSKHTIETNNNNDDQSFLKTHDELLDYVITFLNDCDINFFKRHNKKGYTSVSFPIIGDKHRLDVYISIHDEDDYYQITAFPNIEIPKDDIIAWLIAVNRYNLGAENICACINDNNAIVFWVGQYINGGISQELFKFNLMQIIKTADDDTEIIQEEAKQFERAANTSTKISMNLI
ncbi:MAG: hypothetical protein K2J07_07015 [Muribaculaceae bacterium]|nr:hypothetical protein [Muribaculaceae bacterium]MDE6832463.1 hypothetical protein [Muribaculaceae bacterium]